MWELTTYDADGVTWTCLEWRAPESIDQWVFDRADRLVAVHQAPDRWGVRPVALPAEYLLHMAYDPRGFAPEGNGVMRAVEPLVRDLLRLENVVPVAAQRWAIPTPTIGFDAETYLRLVPEGDVAAEQARWEDIAKAYCGGERAYFVRPPWITLETYGGSATFTPDGVEVCIDRRYRRVLMQYLAQHLMLGVEGGSYSLGQVHAGLQAQRAVNDLQWVCDGLATVIPRMLAWQFGDVDRARLPILRFDGIRSALWTERINELVSAIAAGLMTPTDDDEAEFRRALELLQLPDGVGRDPTMRLTQAKAMRPPAAPSGGAT